MRAHLLHTEVFRGSTSRGIWLTEQGLLTTFSRISSKAQEAPPPLFGTCDLTLERPLKSIDEAANLKDWLIVKERRELAKPWQRLQDVADFASFIRLNATHFPDPADTFRLAEKILDGLAVCQNSRAALVKGVFLVLKQEGFPVVESWYQHLPRAELETMASLYHNSIQAETVSQLSGATIEALWESLRSWVRRETQVLFSSP